MKVIVLGGGVIGVSTAYYLARAGAEVTVLERQSDVALETSFANAGQVSPGYSTPWAAPGIPLKAIKWLFQRHAPLAIRADGSLFQLRWMAAMLRNCTDARYAVNKERMTRLAEYSRDCLRQLRQDTGIEYEQRTQGTLQVFRTAAQMEAARRDTAVLEECGVPYRLMTDAGELAEYEPALARAQGLVGALHLPGDETGDCQRFTTELAEKARRLGVQFRFNTDIQRLQTQGQAITGVQLAGGELLSADRYVLALGSYSRALLAPLGLDLPVYPVKGYSLTVPLLDPANAPVSTVMDETYKVALTRFDHRIRVGGMAELGGFDLRLNPRRRETLEMVLGNLFTGGDMARGEFWTGLRPTTPYGIPVAEVTCSTGHGTLGWTMAAGSGKLMADLTLGRQPDIRTDGLGLERYSKQSVLRLSGGRQRPIHA